MFQDAMCDAGGLVKECHLCGRTYFDVLHVGQHGLAEFTTLTKKAKEQPDKYIPVEQSVAFGWIAGFQVVWGCACGWKRFTGLETFLIDNREQVSRFYKKMAESAAQQAKELERISESI